MNDVPGYSRRRKLPVRFGNLCAFVIPIKFANLRRILPGCPELTNGSAGLNYGRTELRRHLNGSNRFFICADARHNQCIQIAVRFVLISRCCSWPVSDGTNR
jgi:hypothetical protein